MGLALMSAGCFLYLSQQACEVGRLEAVILLKAVPIVVI